MGVKIEVTSHAQEFIGATEQKRQLILEKWGIAAEANAKKEIDIAVYDTPPKGYKRTGRLRNSLSHVTQDRAMYVGTNVEYAPYVELGTSRGMKPRPYLKPAILNHLDEYKSIAENTLKE